MSDMYATTPTLTELANKLLQRDGELENTTVRVLAVDPVRRLPGSTKRDTGFLASYKNEDGTVFMMGIATPINEEADSSTHPFAVVDGWYVTVAQTGGIPIEGYKPTPPPVLVRGCLLVDDHVVANGFFDMTGTAAQVVGEFNGQSHVQQFENRSAVLCCEFVATADNRLSGELAAIDSTGNDLYRERLDTSLEPPDWSDEDSCLRKDS
jgi:hypothetical protein